MLGELYISGRIEKEQWNKGTTFKLINGVIKPAVKNGEGILHRKQ